MTRSLTGSPSNSISSGGKANCLPSGGTCSLALNPSTRPFLFSLLQEGVFIRTRSGISIKEFITEYLNAESDYISKRISTLFLNGTPVDDLDYEILTDGSVLALSAAMPGLAGAILRKGGHLAGLRTRVEKKHSAEKAASGAWVKLKLFNALVPELGPGLLSRGIWVKASSISSFPAESNILPPYTDPDNPDEMVHVIVKAV